MSNKEKWFQALKDQGNKRVIHWFVNEKGEMVWQTLSKENEIISTTDEDFNLK